MSNVRPPATKGFTLIELLVVMSIIAMLASLVLVSINKTREKARDARRASDFLQLRTAIELYALNNNNKYYVPTESPCDKIPQCGKTWSCQTNGNWPASFRNAMAPYIAIPNDPLPICSAPSYRKYAYISNGTDYKLQFLGPENPNYLKNYADPFYDGGPKNVGDNEPNPGSCTGPGDGTNITAWAFYTPGAECWHH